MYQIPIVPKKTEKKKKKTETHQNEAEHVSFTRSLLSSFNTERTSDQWMVRSGSRFHGCREPGRIFVHDRRAMAKDSHCHRALVVGMTNDLTEAGIELGKVYNRFFLIIT